MDQKNNLTIPVAIVIAGLLIAAALFISRGGVKAPDAATTGTDTAGLPNTDNMVIKPVTSADHILGDPNADIFLVEYSDTECPFCKAFQPTMHQIIDTYGKDGKVAWVYRQFPLYKGTNPLHPRAEKEAEATECAAELGGNTVFWKYLDAIYTVTTSNNTLDPAQLPIIAGQVGLDKTAFMNCLNSGKYTQQISDDYDAALAAGGQGTPYTVIVTRSGIKLPINGAQPYSKIAPVLDTLIASGTNAPKAGSIPSAIQ